MPEKSIEEIVEFFQTEKSLTEADLDLIIDKHPPDVLINLEQLKKLWTSLVAKDKRTADWIRTILTNERKQRDEAVKSKDNAYHERNLLVQALTKLYPSYLARHDENDESWEKDWMWIVYVEIPTKTKVVSGDQHNHVPESKWFKNEFKQVSWHIHDNERHLFNHLEVKENNWDGHTTEEKYKRLQAIVPHRG